MRFWKDTSGRYLDRQTVRVLLSDGKTGPLDGFTARNGRTYKGYIELDREAWQLKVRSLGYNEGEGVSDQPEYEVNPEPLGRCPFDEDCQVVESPTQFVCERALKREEPGADDAQAPKGCGFVLPRTVCKREITREEAQVYVRMGKTELLSDFTSRFGRPFAATLVLKENGRHGFEFQPREGRSGASAGRKKATRKKTTRKKKAATRKKTTRKASRKTSSTRKKAAAKNTTPRKKTPRKKSAARTRGDG